MKHCDLLILPGDPSRKTRRKRRGEGSGEC